mgnify:CR=1 FL=1
MEVGGHCEKPGTYDLWDLLKRDEEKALEAGCDMVLVCNNQPMAAAVLDGLPREARPASRVRMMRMYGNGGHASLAELKQDAAWRESSAAVAAMDRTPELDLDDDEIRS